MVLFASLGNILHPEIFQGLNVDTHKGGDRHAVRALPDGIRMSPEYFLSHGRPNGSAACFQEL